MNIIAKRIMLVAALGAVAVAANAAFYAPKVRKIRTCRENMWNIQRAQNDYFMETGAPAVKVADLVPRQLNQVPVCPSGGHYSVSNPSHKYPFENFPTCSNQNPRHKLYLRCGNRNWLERLLLPVSDFIFDARE